MTANPYAALPRIDDLLTAGAALVQDYGREDTKSAMATAMNEVRQSLDHTSSVTTADLTTDVLARAGSRLAASRRPGPRRVVNATGIIVHTNLGRAPLTDDAIQAVVDAARYCDLEFDLHGGDRGSRGSHVDALLAAATGAEDAMAVNNCAAALVLVLAGLATGRQVPVSRGHLVEIGGSFRLPEIMAASGARLLEVGTTNRTTAADYAAGEDVAALLTVHPSNFSQEGFVAQPALAAVAAVARTRGVPLVHDAGSGMLVEADGPLAGELSMAGALRAGADLVLASGDKLLGGPQAGLIVGRADLVERLRRHPLARALRLDKLRLAALNATLRGHLRGAGSQVTAMLADQPALQARTEAMAGALGGRVEEDITMVGGGSAPGVGIASPVVVLDRADLGQWLRQHDPPVIARVRQARTILDLRTVDPADDGVILAAVNNAAPRQAAQQSPHGSDGRTGRADNVFAPP